MPRLPPGLPALIAVQLATESVVLVADWAITGSVGLLLPCAAGAAVAGGHGFRMRRRRVCHRGPLRTLGLAVGLVHAPIGALVYAAAWSLEPALYGFAAAGLPLAAGGIGLLVGGLAFVGASCALDLGVHAAGGVQEAPPRLRSFREPPG